MAEAAQILPEIITTVAEFLDWENQQATRHEWIDGRIVAMTGGSIRHAQLIARLVRRLGNHLDGTPCIVVACEVRVQVAKNMFYPDVVVTCARHESQDMVCKDPKLIIEVLSNSTASHDRTKKRIAYQQIESLEEYGLVAQDVQHITLFRRAEGWRQIVVIEGALELRSVGWIGELDDLYRDFLIDSVGKATGILPVLQRRRTYRR
ncbi:MAG: Uma2 family endonuclease [Synechococcaceae cyanobacterium SM1_2_3]|nr:Uma2 family endonuclease [Synechococcaceae cyanobacterium SM1_2_3]